MIRINLLPQTKRAARARRSGGGNTQAWLILYAVVSTVYIALMGVVYMLTNNELSALNDVNADLERQIQTVRAVSSRLEEVEAQIDQSRRLGELVNELNAGRTGPARMLVEVSRLLSEGQVPEIDPQQLEEMRRANPHAGYNRNWDVRRLWLVSFEEEERSCVIRGMGKTHEDIAEFLQRLALSNLFENVTLARTEAVSDAETELELIGFELNCDVRY